MVVRTVLLFVAVVGGLLALVVTGVVSTPLGYTVAAAIVTLGTVVATFRIEHITRLKHRRKVRA